EVRATPQLRRAPWSWQISASATQDDVTRVRILRLGIVAAVALVALLMVAGGARLLRTAPPPLLYAPDRHLGSLPLRGGQREPVVAFAGKFLIDVNVSTDGRRILPLPNDGKTAEFWDAASMLLDDRATSTTVAPPADTIIRDLGVWMPDSEHV